ncbi:TPA: DEAD/DEAH box helicase family protein [archaeon]|nr:DEAD/DEAH box helicase family protein [Candidatus Undinarchaeales archaeon SRR5007147.bin71]
MGSGFLKEGAIEKRLYQETILGTAVSNNTLVVLPTGLGKTFVAALLAAQRLGKHPEGRVLFLAPTKPLVEQHRQVWENAFKFGKDEFVSLTGEISPEKRKILYNDAQFIFATPQVIQNDLLSKNLVFEDYSLLIVDEAHRAVGDYPYSFIAEKYIEESQFSRVLGLTASPGSGKEDIERICKELFLEKIEYRNRKHVDLAPYVRTRKMEWVYVELPREFMRMKDALDKVFKENIKSLRGASLLGNSKYVRKVDLLKLQGSLAKDAAENPDLYKYLSIVAGAMKVYYAQELLETQGIAPLQEYFMKLKNDPTKAAMRLRIDPRMKMCFAETESLTKLGFEHPKMEKLYEIISTGSGQTLVFANYRASVDNIVKFLEGKGISTGKLIGQAGRRTKGQSQKVQIEQIDKFKAGKFKVLVATSVGEEGLDIPVVESVVFYEPVPSAIRSIQRSGRTARTSPGNVYILMSKGTRDEAYYWSSKRKEDGMERALGGVELKPAAQKTLEKFSTNTNDKVIVIADSRESGSGIMKGLSKLGCEIQLKHLDVADFQLSDRVGVERKNVDDFLQSIIDGRLMDQVASLCSVFERPVLIVEGSGLYNKRNLHPNAIRGMISSIAIDFQLPIVTTEDVFDTAAYIYQIAKREQIDEKREVRLRSGAKPRLLSETQQYIVESLPNVGPSLAKRLLQEFGGVSGVFQASEEDLMRVEKIGKKKAKEIRSVIESKYSLQ